MYVIDHKIHRDLYPMREEISGMVFDHLIMNKQKVNPLTIELVNKAVSCLILNIPRYSNRFGITLDSGNYTSTVVINGQKSIKKISYKYTKILFDCLEKLSYIKINKGHKRFDGGWELINGKWY